MYDNVHNTRYVAIYYFNGHYYISAYTVLIVYNTVHTGIKTLLHLQVQLYLATMWV